MMMTKIFLCLPLLTLASSLSAASVEKTRKGWFPAAQNHNRRALSRYLREDLTLLDVQDNVEQKPCIEKDYTALMYAIVVEDKNPANAQEVVQLLIDRGAALNLVTPRGDTALALAIAHDRRGLVKKLLDSGRVDLNQKNTFGKTPLMSAIEWPATNEILSMLMQAGARHDCVDDSGRTALMLAAAHNAPMAAKKLLTQGADPWVKDRVGRLFLNHCKVRLWPVEDRMRWEVLGDEMIAAQNYCYRTVAIAWGRRVRSDIDWENMIAHAPLIANRHDICLGSWIDQEDFKALQDEALAAHFEANCYLEELESKSKVALRHCCEFTTGKDFLDDMDRRADGAWGSDPFAPLVGCQRLTCHMEAYLWTIAPSRPFPTPRRRLAPQTL